MVYIFFSGDMHPDVLQFHNLILFKKIFYFFIQVFLHTLKDVGNNINIIEKPQNINIDV